MAKTFRPYTLDQQLLLPPDLRAWVPEGHLALYVSDVVDALDLSAILSVYAAADPHGGVPSHPAMLVKLLVYASCTGMPSSRRIERATSMKTCPCACSPATSTPTTIPSRRFDSSPSPRGPGSSFKCCSSANARAW